MKEHIFNIKPAVKDRAVKELMNTPASRAAREKLIELHHKIAEIMDELLGDLYKFLEKENPDFNPAIDCVIVHHDDPKNFKQITVRYRGADMLKIWPITIRNDKTVEIKFEEVWR